VQDLELHIIPEHVGSTVQGLTVIALDAIRDYPEMPGAATYALRRALRICEGLIDPDRL
jgi:hypothetical protein